MAATDMTREALGGWGGWPGQRDALGWGPCALEGRGLDTWLLSPSPAPCQLQVPPRDVFLLLLNGLTYSVPVINLPLIKDAKLTSGG